MTAIPHGLGGLLTTEIERFDLGAVSAGATVED